MNRVLQTRRTPRLPGRPAARLKLLRRPQALAEPCQRGAVTDCHYWRHPGAAIPAGSSGGPS